MNEKMKSLTQAIEKVAEEIAREREMEKERTQSQQKHHVLQEHKSDLESAG